jgi:hypothetical protein
MASSSAILLLQHVGVLNAEAADEAHFSGTQSCICLSLPGRESMLMSCVCLSRRFLRSQLHLFSYRTIVATTFQLNNSGRLC